MSLLSEYDFDLASAMEMVARHLLGEPNAALSSADELRFGNRGSLSVQLTGEKRGTYFDNETGEGGGVLKLISTRRGLANGAAWGFMREIGVNIPLLNANRPPSKRIVAAYDYVDVEGVLAFQVVRFDPKDFRQRRPDGGGGWIWKVKGLAPILYRLPDIVAASSEQPIFIAEGEKDDREAPGRPS